MVFPVQENEEREEDRSEGLCCTGVIVTEVITTVAELFTFLSTNMILTLYMEHWLLAGTPTLHYTTL